MGLVPRQYSIGGNIYLGLISRSGDSYLRTLLIQGARSSVQMAHKVPTEKEHVERNRAAVPTVYRARKNTALVKAFRPDGDARFVGAASAANVHVRLRRGLRIRSTRGG